MTSHAAVKAITTWIAIIIFTGTALGLVVKEVIREYVPDAQMTGRWLSALNWLLYPLLALCLELAALRVLLLT